MLRSRSGRTMCSHVDHDGHGVKRLGERLVVHPGSPSLQPALAPREEARPRGGKASCLRRFSFPKLCWSKVRPRICDFALESRAFNLGPPTPRGRLWRFLIKSITVSYNKLEDCGRIRATGGAGRGFNLRTERTNPSPETSQERGHVTKCHTLGRNFAGEV